MPTTKKSAPVSKVASKKTAPKKASPASKAKPARKAAPAASKAPAVNLARKTVAAKAKAKSTPKASKPEAIRRVERGDGRIMWCVDPAVYPLDVVYQAAFTYIDRAYLYLDLEKDGAIRVELKAKPSLDDLGLDALLGEFANELLNQAVRRRLAEDNRRLRELIVAKALFAAARPAELQQIRSSLDEPAPPAAAGPQAWGDISKDEQDELDKLLAEIERDFAEDPAGIAVPWDEKYGEEGAKKESGAGGEDPDAK